MFEGDRQIGPAKIDFRLAGKGTCPCKKEALFKVVNLPLSMPPYVVPLRSFVTPRIEMNCVTIE